jgi:signal peptidase I
MPEPTPDKARGPSHGPKETISSLIIAFVFAFVFRGFVVEAFVIPTGSMGPTLLGKHTRFQSPESGVVWPVDPSPSRTGGLVGVGDNPDALTATDPMTGAQVGNELPLELGQHKDLLAGDRIFVLKYLYSIYDPARFDVVVFKYPGRPESDMDMGQQQNYIKRLVGLPGEEVALVDGDVFRRPATGQAGAQAHSDWAAAGWEITRKSERTQRELWQPIYSSEYTPLHPERDTRRWFDSPWKGRTPDGVADPSWNTDGQVYTYAASAPTTLAWDNDARHITDRYAYDERARGLRQNPEFAVSDVRMAVGVEPAQDGLTLAAVLDARGHEFRADIAGKTITIRMRPMTGDAPGEWRTLAEETIGRALEPGRVTNLEFWHVDQSVQVWIGGDRVAIGEYAWSPAERIGHATGLAPEDLLRAGAGGNPLGDTALYPEPSLRWELAGSPVALHRVRLDRDLFYRPGVYNPGFTRAGEASLATHPSQPLVLGPDQFFVCGDNSPNSLDGRLWDSPDPWVYEQIDPTIGIVPRDLLIGKAFFVYFPAMHKDKRVPIPDVGRMRFIW